MRVLPDHWVNLCRGKTVSRLQIRPRQSFQGHYSQSEESGDQTAATSAGSGHDVAPGHLGSLHLDLESGLDLSHLCLDELARGIALGVILDQNRLCLVCAILGDEPSGTVGQEAAR